VDRPAKTDMDVRNLDRIGFVTRHFRDLQGLRWMVPLGMFTLFQGLAPSFEHEPPAFGIACLAALVGGSLVLRNRSKAYYESLLGEVEVQQTETAVADWLPVAVLATAIAAFLLATGSLSLLRFYSIALGSVLLGRWLQRGRRASQSYYLLFGALLLAVAVLAPESPLAARRELTYGLAGACFIVAGLLDHRQLVRTLTDLPPPHLDGEDAAETPEPAEEPNG
jgi:hypothetical protein